jgi:hypothetical protein
LPPPGELALEASNEVERLPTEAEPASDEADDAELPLAQAGMGPRADAIVSMVASRVAGRAMRTGGSFIVGSPWRWRFRTC